MGFKIHLVTLIVVLAVTNIANAGSVDTQGRYDDFSSAVTRNDRAVNAASAIAGGGGLDGGGSDSLEMSNSGSTPSNVTLAPGGMAAFLSIQSNQPVVVRCKPTAENIKVVCSCAFAGNRYEFHVTTIDRNGAINDHYVSPFAISSSKEQSRQECLETISSNPVCSGRSAQ
jgi:hypothetical protein